VPLVADSTGVETLYYPTLQDFTPVTGSKSYHANLGDLSLKLIKRLEPGNFSVGDVVTVISGNAATLHVVLTEFNFNGSVTATVLVSNGFLSEAKGYTDFATGGTFSAVSSTGEYNPQIIAFSQSDVPYETYAPPLPLAIPQTYRPQNPVWVVSKNFTKEQDTSDLGTAQARGYVSDEAVDILPLLVDGTFFIGQYVETPEPQQVLSTDLASNCYLDKTRGAIRLVAKVLKGFTFRKRSDQEYKAVFDSLVADGYLDVVEIVPFVDCAGRANFSAHPFRYKARFGIGEYVRYRPEGGFDSSALEECVRQNQTCGNVTPACKRLIEENLPLPRYFFVIKDFTPKSTSVDEMVKDGTAIEVDRGVFVPNYVILVNNDQPIFSSPEINNYLISQKQIERVEDLVIGQTVEIKLLSGQSVRVYYWTGSAWDEQASGLPTFRDIFRFAPKDSTSFRNGSELRQYEATQHVTPILDLETYYDSGVFVRSERSETVRYLDPSYNYEDVIYETTPSSVRFYRVETPFTPPVETTSWVGQTLNTPRIEEVNGNLLKFVIKAEDSERVYSRLGTQVGAVKLGTMTVSMEAKSTGGGTGTFVWEATPTSSQTPSLSYSSLTQTQFGKVDYGNGTLAL
jgi:hypothetical protein